MNLNFNVKNEEKIKVIERCYNLLSQVALATNSVLGMTLNYI